MGFVIEPDRLYLECDLLTTGIFTDDELKRGRQQGLQCKEIRRGKRAYMGRWLLDWLEQPARKPSCKSKPVGGRRCH